MSKIKVFILSLIINALIFGGLILVFNHQYNKKMEKVSIENKLMRELIQTKIKGE